MSHSNAQFVFMTCRAGAENAVKAEVARTLPEWRFSYSRPGFLTFKHTGTRPLDERQLAERSWTFAHAHGISLGSVKGETLETLAADVWRLPAVAELPALAEIADLHVWQPESDAPSDSDDDSVESPLSSEIEAAIRAAASESTKLRAGEATPSGKSRRLASPRDALVLDVVVLAPGEWWIGCHRAMRRHERWPGGAIPVRMPEHAVSRAYMKMEEALQWSMLPLTREDECVEVGCAPGGASQALLDRGLFVTGIDPAEVDPAVIQQPRFRHLKKRGKDVRKREFEGVRWIAADMNIAPEATLDEIEAIVAQPGLTIRGMILTLKFSDWNAAARLPELVSRVSGWGFRDVRTRQLVTGGQEVCLVALRRKALRRLGRKSRHKQEVKSGTTTAPDSSPDGTP